MKKVIAILGSKRRMHTYHLLAQIGELLEMNQIDLEVIELHQYRIDACIGCECCITHGKCPLQDDQEIIMTKIESADALVLASPVYLQQITGKLKNFIDRTCVWYHRPKLVAKPLLALSTTKGSGLKATLKYMESMTSQWGAINAGALGRTIFNVDKSVDKKEIAKFITLIKDPISYKPSLRDLIYFEVSKSLALFLKGLDSQYWEQNDWVKKKYFYSCKISFIKSSLSAFIGNRMRKGMSRRSGPEANQDREKALREKYITNKPF